MLLGTAAAPAVAGPSGKEIYQEVLASIGVYDDPELAAYVGGLVREIVSVSEMAGEQFTFTLLDSQDVNAFATRDNYVYVNRGLLNYVDNEAQLVSVLAHEVGHVTRNHVNEMEGQAGGAQVLAMIAAVLSGSNEVYEASMAYANSLIKGHGRKNELEADEAGALYMARLGYDPDEMIQMLTVMKDMESLQKKRAAEQGAPRQTYHGIFATHPRNDARLRSAVSKAAAAESARRDNGAARYREITEGLVWGENFVDKEQPPNRYYDMGRRVRFDFPEGWQHQSDLGAGRVTGQPADGAAVLGMQVHPRTAQGPEEYLYNHLNLPPLSEGREIQPARLKGYTGVLPGQGRQRIAVVYYKLNAYLFTGEVADPAHFDTYDELFLESVETFRPISSREIEGQSPKRIHYVKATSATTFDALGEALKLSESELEDLRLINGHYPTGEPQPGEWIKIFQQ
ncbi:MAG: M48 family metalloprotease [Xanthomonadales bacterium]|nr:M48 family metalloprotease [Xanthomonadales bacterium]NIX12057.1 M48 family metalloprotease [Xanthomonadales bacterium]